MMPFASMPGRRIAPRLRRHWALATMCALFALAGALTLDDHGRAWVDAWHQRAIGRVPLDYLAGDGERAFEQLIEPQDRFYGAAWETPLVLAERLLGLEGPWDLGRPPDLGEGLTFSRHFLTHLLFVAGGAFCYLLTLRLFGSRALALVAMVLFLLHPRIYAHSFFNSKDVPFLAAFMIALYLTHRAFRRDTLGAFLLCGVGVALLVNLRITGLLLFAAVLVLRALDLLTAGGADERRRVLLTGAGFALAAMLTFHAALPRLWTNPAEQVPEMFRVLNAHPAEAFNLFQGDWFYAPDGPPLDYVPVWIAISTPPIVLLLALAGAVALAGRGIRRPRDVLRDGPTRFGLLLLALPIVATIAVVALGSNFYHDWRHLYFLYAPLLLLAIFGLRWLAASFRGRWTRAGVYALAGTGAAVALVSMVRIHPHEANYFTSLTDRTTPEWLLFQYDTLFWEHAVENVLGDILDDHPSGRLFASGQLQKRVMPPGGRERFTATVDFRSGERNFSAIRDTRACSAPLSAGTYARRIYASTLYCVVDPVAYFGAIRRAARASEPLVRAAFDIHRDGRTLTYLRDGCPREDITARFFLHVYPVDPADIPARYRRHGFDNLDFSSSDTLGNAARIGVPRLSTGMARIDGDCVATAQLPDYPIARLHTGQFTDAGIVWEVEFTPDGRGPPDYAGARRAALATAPLARSTFAIHRDGRALTYLRDGCTEAEAAARFFLHVDPVDTDDLPEHRREYGFDNLDFSLATRGARIDGDCVAVVPLPAWPIARIETGQYDDAGRHWTAEFPLPE